MLKKGAHIHLIGIGGVSMSGIAKILFKRGYKVSGSDLKKSKYLKDLDENNVNIIIGHKKENIIGADYVVYSSAVPEDNVEIKAAKKLNIPIFRRAEMLAELMKEKKTIAVAGTHGKTTTTAMLAAIFKNADKDPAIMVGGYLPEIGGNVSDGKGEFFITEADESDGSFLYFDPYTVLFTNLELDHADFYKDIDEIKYVFKQFSDKVNNKGFIIYNRDDKNLAKLFKNNQFKFGIKDGDYISADIKYCKERSSFKFYSSSQYIGEIQLKVPGEYNIYNALAAASCAFQLGIDFDIISTALKNFKGVGRRFEFKGKLLDNKVDVVDDYAHHPSEIKSLLKAAQNIGYKEVIVVFQPHRYSRTKKLFNEFSSAFGDADTLYLTDIYSAEEKNDFNISSQDLQKAVEKNSDVDVRYFSSFSQIKADILNNLKEGQLILTVGAGNIYKLGEDLLSDRRK
ncbi:MULTISPECIES: UDP-N-acetylmuramate--L-alanine ligase [unclassified Halanaerobium]|uniref:UDP-N-acetylmuramate--L-alanine ligase n=1 Tax=unclassified Halanaerobium TaxID=2641197 RepID=UPI000DF188D8|nr:MULTISPECIES: UDP-N-acetylmuramate--L-alanine ligase [unclassified Halanaerobium]RCW51383.1 UDP-N-acetylmuramate--L-alanine ligase [Halanaerobium sp. MA284_MarDTE_T2]RCW81418.1 UDP-N-acetylmuramate--L-alanine ligase [Halanaerobium sp. DL-01]